MEHQPRCVCISLRRLARATTRIYDEALADSGLKITQYSLLCAVERQQPVAVSVLAHEVELDRTTLARNLAPLERDGLLALQAGADRRVTKVTLTARGQKAIEIARPLWKLAQERIARKIGLERMSVLRALAAEFSSTS